MKDVRLAVPVSKVTGPHDHIRVAIAVDIPRARDRPAEMVKVCLAIHRPVGGRAQTGPGTIVSVGRAPGGRGTTVVGPDDHIAIAIAVHVPRA